ncbi:CHAT domain-containing protein [Amycolatopsis sp. NPDC051758]|uniref:CHAT domain-containing protein n=1 Tax=Amycolatopsis sp. NPDC051758 TaxID=3363935 RepID=UPI0037A40E3C
MHAEREHGERLLREAVAAYESGDYDGCLNRSLEAEDLFTQLGDRPRALAARQRQAMVRATSGDLGTAIEINRQLVRHYLELGDEISAAKVGTNLGYNYRLLGRLDQGLAAYNAARRVFSRYPERVFETAMTHMNLGAVHRSLGNLARAHAHARRGARLFGTLTGTEMRVIDCLLNAAIAVDLLGRTDDAEALRQQSDELARRIGSRHKLGRISHSRAASLARRGDYRGALPEQHVALLHTLTAPTLTISYVQEVLRNTARLHLRTGSPDEAWPFALLASRLASRTLHGLHRPRTRGEWRARQAEVFDLVCELLVRRKDWAGLAVAIETTRAQQPIADGAPVHLLLPSAEATEAEHRMALGPLPRFTVGDARLDYAAAVASIADGLTADPNEQLACRATLRQVAGLENTQETGEADLRLLAERPGEVLWGTIQLRSSLYWYVIETGLTIGGAVEAGPDSALGDALAELTGALPDTDHYAERVRNGRAVVSGAPGARLAALLVPERIRRNWMEAAAEDSPRRLQVVPAAEVARLPLAALPLDDNGTPLLRWLHPVYVPSPAAAVQAPPPDSGPRPVALTVADTQGDLPGARRLARSFPPSLIGADATAEKFGKLLEDLRTRADGPVTFVYAGHTTSARDADRAVLRLADAELSAAQWLSVRGREDFPLPTTVVLVSCSSGGLGTTDWYGLAAAAIAAGARTVVSTLWPHPDAVSALDRKVIEAVAAGEDVFAVLESASASRSPFVWANYAVISGTRGVPW